MGINSDARTSRVASSTSTSTATVTSPVATALKHELSLPFPLRIPAAEDHSILKQAACLRDFVASYRELESYKKGAPIALTGENLTIPAVAAIARHPDLVADSINNALAALNKDQARIDRLAVSRKVIDEKLSQNKSIYGVSTGFGGSADTRTSKHDALGLALLQHQHAGILPTDLEDIADASASTKAGAALPLSAPLSTLSMPAAWTRAALVVRLNSLLRGHSAASLPLLNAMGSLLSKQITPIVPLRGSISASGDLSPLSYIAGALIGERGIYCYAPATESTSGGALGMAGDKTRILRAPDALKAAGLEPVTLRPKEQLAILNGTAFSCGAAALCVEESRQLMLLGAVCTAMGTEAMRGTVDSFNEFIQRIRPHPGQVESGVLMTHLLEKSKLATRHDELHAPNGAGNVGDAGKDMEETIDADAGVLRQDRYPLRTAPQYLGPQLETLQRSAEVIAIECNSTTDNPLIDPDTGIVHHGGNFQAMAVTSALEPLRLALFHVGKLLFAQSTELQNSSMNNGLSGNLAATDPSINFFGKGIDIAMAAYVSELAYLATPVSTGVQSAEMHNQAVNSLALITARYTLQAIDVVQLIVASYLYLLCQAVDLRALQSNLEATVRSQVAVLVDQHFRSAFDFTPIADAVWATYDSSANMDSKPRSEKAARASTQPLVDALLATSPDALAHLPGFQAALTSSIFNANHALTCSYLSDSLAPGAAGYMPAASFLGRTRKMYEFIRRDLGVGMHGRDNLDAFEGGLSHGAWEDSKLANERGRTIGGNIAVIYEAIRDGRMKGVIVDMFGTDAL